MKQTTVFALLYTVLIFVLVTLIGLFGYNRYSDWFRPTPLQHSVESPPSPPITQTIAKSAVSKRPAIDPSLLELFPFETAHLENGFRIGQITVQLTDLLSIFSNIAYNSSSDLSNFVTWKSAAAQLSRDAIILDEAVKRGYQLPEEKPLSPENVSSATLFLKTNLENATPSASIDSLVAKRIDDFLVLQPRQAQKE